MPAGIRRIEVRGLFGRHNYTIEAPAVGDADLSRILVLYGDNGSGKTTILRTLFHLLSPAPSRGHRTELLDTPFRRFLVEFRDGRKVSASRESNDEYIGPYDLALATRSGGDHCSMGGQAGRNAVDSAPHPHWIE